MPVPGSQFEGKQKIFIPSQGTFSTNAESNGLCDLLKGLKTYHAYKYL